MSQGQTTPTIDVQAVRAMFGGLDLPVCDDEQAVRRAVDAQRDARNRQLNSTKGSVAVQAKAWFEQVDALLSRRAELIEAMYGEFRNLADSVLATGGSLAKKRLSRTARKELPALAQRWLGAREDLADSWTERYLEERKGRLKTLALEQPDEPASAPRAAPRRQPANHGAPAAAAGGEGNRKVLLATAGAVLVALTVGVLYQTEGLPSFEPQAAAGLSLADPGPLGDAGEGAGPAEPTQDPTGQVVDATDPPSAEAEADEPTKLDREKVALLLAALARKVQQHQDAQAPQPSPLQVATVSSPDVSFGGHELTVSLATSDFCTRVLHEAEFRGVRLDSVRRSEVGLEIVFQVDRLPAGQRDARASWSFRLSDSAGTMSDPVKGSCRVLPGGW